MTQASAERSAIMSKNGNPTKFQKIDEGSFGLIKSKTSSHSTVLSQLSQEAVNKIPSLGK